VPHYQLVTTDRDVLGARELDRSDWPPGSVIDAAAGESEFRVVRQLEYDHERDGDPE
jgi:hypothetical protein